MVSDTVQVRVNSDPATVLPELLIVAEMRLGSEGTANNMAYSHSMHASLDTPTSDRNEQGLVGHCLVCPALISSHKASDV